MPHSHLRLFHPIFRRGFVYAVLLTLLTAAFVAGCSRRAAAPAEYTPREGDVLFQSLPPIPIIVAIEDATGSPYSHCGIVVKRGSGWGVLEAIGPVREIPMEQWIAQGRGKAFTAYRLKPVHLPHIPAFIDAARTHTGKPYDIRYRFDDESIYCSELIYKAWRDATGEKMGDTVLLGNLAWQKHEALIREIEGGDPPMDREMITPRDLAKAPQLEEVFRRGMVGP